MSTDQVTVVRRLDRAAVLGSTGMAGRAGPADLARPTPCRGWTLAELLTHMSIQHRGFAAAARGNGGDLALWRPRPPAADPVADYLAATGEVVVAFAADGIAQRTFRLPEISTSEEFPAGRAIRFHFIDYVVHGWDVARSIGAELRLDEAVLNAALQVARQVPAIARTRPGAPFGPALDVPAGAPLIDRIVAVLGRPPGWAAGPVQRDSNYIS